MKMAYWRISQVGTTYYMEFEELQIIRHPHIMNGYYLADHPTRFFEWSRSKLWFKPYLSISIPSWVTHSFGKDGLSDIFTISLLFAKSMNPVAPNCNAHLLGHFPSFFFPAIFPERFVFFFTKQTWWQIVGEGTDNYLCRQRFHFNRPYHWPCSTNGSTRSAVWVFVMNPQFPLLKGAISHWSFLFEKQDRSFSCWPTVGMMFVEWIRWVSSLPCYEMARLWWNDPSTSNEQSIQKIAKIDQSIW